ncbi:hypothetical protein CPB83DRAFT_906509 [Crepidotus variabilis]|uniref:Uncharacterized protein n=1 Tax=Crepidotus variabilis TaxID=179855 RepID=A0A9P6JQH2_9AGAR|nr:hypothetical protein CPB83DRAFT_906509 [Crepidotus variabilis]
MLTAKLLPSGLDSWTIACLVIYAVAILATFLRLYSKIRRKQLYWDDFWVSVALTSCLISLAVMIVLSTIRLDNMCLTSRSFVLWVSFITLPSTVWSSRISICVSMIRVLLPSRKRTFAKLSCCVLGCCWLAICLQKIWICEGITAPTLPLCAVFTSLTPTLSLSLNILADTFLVVWTALMLMQMRLDKNHRWLLIALADAEHLAYLEIAITLLLCNTTALAPYAYRRCSVDVVSGSFSLGLPVSDFLAPNTFDIASKSQSGKSHSPSTGPNQSVVLDTVGFSVISGVSFNQEDDRASFRVQ